MVQTGNETKHSIQKCINYFLNTKIEGKFEKGTVVQILNSKGSVIAKGISNYSSDEINVIRGYKSDEIENVLGYKYDDNVIHIDNLTIL